jgi:hypothetical protein
MHNEPLENLEKFHGGVGLSHWDDTTLIVYETGPQSGDVGSYMGMWVPIWGCGVLDGGCGVL